MSELDLEIEREEREEEEKERDRRERNKIPNEDDDSYQKHMQITQNNNELNAKLNEELRIQNEARK